MTVELSVVIPCFNEESNLPDAIPRLLSILEGSGIDFELICVDDGSADGTARTIEAFAARDERVRLVQHAENRGWGAGVRSGAEAGRGAYVTFMVADEQVSFEKIPEIFNLIRDHPPGTIVKVRRIERRNEPVRRLYSWVYNNLMNLLFGRVTTDYNGTPKVLLREDFAALAPTYSGNFFDVELITKAVRSGFKIVEIDVASERRSGGVSSIKMIREPLRLIRDAWHFRRYGRAPVS